MKAAQQGHQTDLERVLAEACRLADRADPMLGRTLAGRYRVESKLADGGMSTIYEGTHETLAVPVAIKVLDAARARDPSLCGRFEREVVSLARLRHPHIVQVLEWGWLDEGGAFLVMERVPGLDLARLLMNEGLLGARRSLHVLRQVALALDHAHARGIVHRDLKPENVMIDLAAGDFAKLLDLGIARHMNAAATYSSFGEVVGTPEYMAPEQAAGMEGVGPAADRYSLAVIALEMLTGELPYPSAPLMTALEMVLQAPPRRPSELGLDVPGLDEVFDRAMARSPSDRFGSAVELVDALEAVLGPHTEAELDRNASSGVRARVTAPARLEAADGLDPSPPELSALASAEEERSGSATRTGAAVVLAVFVLMGSSFAAGWIACLSLLG